MTSSHRQSVQVHRRARHKHPKTYMERAGGAEGLQEERVLQVGELPVEFCMNALRLHEGFTPAQFEQRTGLAYSALAPQLAALSAKGLLEVSAERVRPTPLGRAHLNAVLREFL